MRIDLSGVAGESADSTTGRRARVTIGREGRSGWIREAWTFHVQHNYPVKVLVIEGVRFVETVGRIGRANGRWVWCQFSPLIPQLDLTELLDKARADGTLLRDSRAQS